MHFKSHYSRPSALGDSAYMKRRLYNHITLDTSFAKQSDAASTKIGRTTSPVLQLHEERARHRLRSRNARRDVDDLPLGRHSAARAASRQNRRGGDEVQVDYDGEFRSPFACPAGRQSVPCWVPMNGDEFFSPQRDGAKLVSKGAPTSRHSSTAARDPSPQAVEAFRSRYETPRWGEPLTEENPSSGVQKETGRRPAESVSSSRRPLVGPLRLDCTSCALGNSWGPFRASTRSCPQYVSRARRNWFAL